MSQVVFPSIELTAFSCPHCRALTTQHWHRAMVTHAEKDKLPVRYKNPSEMKEAFAESIEDYDRKMAMIKWIDRVSTGLPSIGDRYEPSVRYLDNVDVSECYNCDKVAIWVGDRMLWPVSNESPLPNNDLPDEILTDYLEAGTIVNNSPRGAAALLRLCVQKLCIFLGESGKNINDDIASLVKKGLDPRVQKMLDTLRVFGNNAVHPGELDIQDDRATADKLFAFVNMVADIMISQPNAIAEMYGRIGERPLQAIDKRDAQS